MRPIIGLTSRPRRFEAIGLTVRIRAVEEAYVDSVFAAGGVPIFLTPVAAQDVSRIVDLVDGLVLTGGGDIAPCRYGGVGVETNYEVDESRDEFEIRLTVEAQQRRLPTRAICRGLQIVNVGAGGSLIEDLPSSGFEGHRRVGASVYQAHQPVTLVQDSRLARLIGRSHLSVNSIHHQAVDDIGRGLRIVGRSEDGVVEAIEPLGNAWALTAVQWHPEFLTGGSDEAALALFSRLVQDAATPTATDRP